MALRGLTDSGTGVEANLWGVLGVKLGWVEGVEMNVLGLVAGLDVRHPAVKVPGYGRLGLDHSATAAQLLARLCHPGTGAARGTRNPNSQRASGFRVRELHSRITAMTPLMTGRSR